MSRLQRLSKVHSHLSPRGGGGPPGVSSVLDRCDALWLKVAGGGHPGGEGFREQDPLEDVHGQVRQRVGSTVPLCDVLQLPAAAAFPHCDAVPEIGQQRGLFWVEAGENGPRFVSGMLLLPQWVCGRFQFPSGPI